MITSTANAQVKALSKLIKNARARRQQQLYVVEGIRMFRETPKERIGKVYVSESFAKDPAHEGVFEGTDWEMLSDSVFAAVSDTKTPQGVLCLVKMKENRLENVQDPGNLGTMFRTGEGAGISGVIMDKCTVDIYNPKTIRSTMGSIFRVPFYITEDLHGTLGQLQKKGIRVYAAHLEGSVCYDEPDYTGGTAFLIGNEGNGLTAETAKLADTYIRIPMGGQLESLNAAMAAGISSVSTMYSEAVYGQKNLKTTGCCGIRRSVMTAVRPARTKYFMHWKKYVTCLIWENRSGWNTILMSLNVMQKLVFTRIVLLNRLILIFWRFR